MARRFNWKAMIGWMVFAIALAVLDQWTKGLIQHRLIVGDSIQVTGFFNLVLAYNSGAAFSFLADMGGWQKPLLCIVAILVSIWICVTVGLKSSRFWFCFALALIMAGAIGNVYDRLTYGLVIDFLDFHAFGHHWPSFNLADTYICIGAALFLIVELFSPGGKKE